MTLGDDPTTEGSTLHLPAVTGFTLTSGAFKIPETTVKVNLKPELVGELLKLLTEAVEAGVDADWFVPRFENAASTVVETGSGREYLRAYEELAALAHNHGLLSTGDVRDVHKWAAEARLPWKPSPGLSAETQQEIDDARSITQNWMDALELKAKKRLLRQRSIVRVACADCHSMLAYLVPQARFEFLVLSRGDSHAFEVAHAVGEYGGYARTRCGGRKGRFWVLHADHLRHWLDLGHSDVSLRHEDKGV